ncbi:MAG: hypothetical protein ABIR52_06645 [Casimicrobiaceae bacterium]
MPLVGFRPTKARLIIEDSNDTVLVMKVVMADSESVEFATGGKLDSLSGVLRIRERKEDETPRNGSNVVGSLVYIAESGEGAGHAPAKYQINIAMAPEKFKALLRVAVAGNLPNKFFIDAGERISKTETRGMTYWVGAGGRTKVWDSESHRTLPITKFSMILPIEVAMRGESARAPVAALPGPARGDTTNETVPHEPAVPIESVATNAQVAELVDDLLVFQSETRNTLYALMWVVGIVAVLALVFGIAIVYR